MMQHMYKVLLYWKSSPVLLVVNQKYTKMLDYFIILFHCMMQGPYYKQK